MFRIDHFRGLESVWMIDAKNDNAVDGHWQQTPGDELLSMIEKDIGPVPMVAEDLGIITDAVRKLKQKHKLPGMAVLQFGFDDFDDNPHKPRNITENTVAYTGTHDNNTLRGWFSSLSVQQQEHVRHTIGISPQDDIVWSMIESSMFSRACLSIIPMQDFLQLGEDARLNTPGTMEGNWNWMLSMESLDNDLQLRIHDLLNESGRLANE
jgi:4-alpha-glucanotransferase